MSTELDCLMGSSRVESQTTMVANVSPEKTACSPSRVCAYSGLMSIAVGAVVVECGRVDIVANKSAIGAYGFVVLAHCIEPSVAEWPLRRRSCRAHDGSKLRVDDWSLPRGWLGIRCQGASI